VARTGVAKSDPFWILAKPDLIDCLHARQSCVRIEDEAMKQAISNLEHNAAAIKRWRSRLKRAMTMLEKLERQRKRFEKVARAELAIAPPTATRPKPVPASALVAAVRTVVKPEPKPVVTEVDTSFPAFPAFLQRNKLDPVAAEIANQQETTKRAKSRGRVEKMKAKQRGDLKKMPLTGRAALDAIRNG
jgi:hypothetical protein